MTRKDYVLIADALRSARDDRLGRLSDPKELAPTVLRDEYFGVLFAARVLAGWLAKDNPRFDHDRFLKACGL